jgi:hypothetical protein
MYSVHPASHILQKQPWMAHGKQQPYHKQCCVLKIPLLLILWDGTEQVIPSTVITFDILCLHLSSDHS